LHHPPPVSTPPVHRIQPSGSHPTRVTVRQPQFFENLFWLLCNLNVIISGFVSWQLHGRREGNFSPLPPLLVAFCLDSLTPHCSHPPRKARYLTHAQPLRSKIIACLEATLLAFQLDFLIAVRRNAAAWVSAGYQPDSKVPACATHVYGAVSAHVQLRRNKTCHPRPVTCSLRNP